MQGISHGTIREEILFHQVPLFKQILICQVFINLGFCDAQRCVFLGNQPAAVWSSVLLDTTQLLGIVPGTVWGGRPSW